MELFSADLLDMGSFDKAVEGCEYVCHVAAVAAFNVKDPKKEIVDPSLEGTRNVFSAIAKAQTAKYASSFPPCSFSLSSLWMTKRQEPS